jgi:GTP cyclohydrolase III
MKLNQSKEWFERRIPVSDEMEADNTNELIEAMKEGFAVRLADAEAKTERYRQALVECAKIVQNGGSWYGADCASKLNDIIMDALK